MSGPGEVSLTCSVQISYRALAAESKCAASHVFFSSVFLFSTRNSLDLRDC